MSGIWARAGVWGLMAAATLLTLDMYLPGGLVEGSRSLDSARTAAFTTLSITGVMSAPVPSPSM